MPALPRYKLIFFAPPPHVATIKAAIFASSANAGRYTGRNNAVYTECAWTTTGTGQFRPGDAATPYLGREGRAEEVQEAKVEVLCYGEEGVKRAVGALKAAHPYEVPAYEVYRLEDF